MYNVKFRSVRVTNVAVENNKYYTFRGPGSVVGIATGYGLDGPESNPGGDEIFPPVQTGPGAHPASSKMGTGSFPKEKCGRVVQMTTNPILVPLSYVACLINFRPE